MKKQDFMKQLLSVILVAALLIVPLMGCSSSKSDSEEDSAGTEPATSSGTESGNEQADETEEQPTGSIEFWSMLTQQERADALQKMADTYVQ